MEFLGLILTFISALIVALGMIFISFLFGHKNPNKIKSEPFECGMEPAEKPKRYIHTNFYLTAILFVVFDIEIIFLYPWAVNFNNLPSSAIYSVIIFVLILTLALFYVIKRGALKWD